MFLLVPAHPGYLDKIQRAVKQLCCMCVCIIINCHMQLTWKTFQMTENAKFLASAKVLDF